MELLFPYEEPRKVQRALITQLQSCIENKQNLIVHAPTGLGKTAAILSVALPYAINHNLTVFFITPKHSQHHIAVETLKEIREKYKFDFQIVDFIGKRHMCLQPGVELLPNSEFHYYCRDLREKDTCEFFLNTKSKAIRDVCSDNLKEPLHVEELFKICKNHSLCPYEMAGIISRKARVIIADYHHILSPGIRQSLFNRIQKNLSECIICFDEAHNVPNKCRDLLTASLSSITIDRALKENKNFNFDYEENLFNIQNNISGLTKSLPIEKNEALIKKEDFNVEKGLIEPLREAADIVREKQKQSSLGSIANFLEAWLGPDEAFTRIISRNFTRHGKPYIGLTYNCLDPRLLVSQLDAHSLIFMSGTLSPTTMYLDLLGLDSKKTITTEYKDPFPKTNRLNLIVPSTTTKYSKRDEIMFKRISKMCSDMVNEIPGNVAIFFPSYSLRDNVNYFFQHEIKKRIVLEQPRLTKPEKQGLIDAFKSLSEEGAVLLGASSGSFGEGIDLPGNFLKGVIIVGLPLAKPDLETQELINYYDSRFSKGWDYAYVIPAIIKSLQNAGRCIRSETDKGCIIYLDERYAWDNYKKCFPDDAAFDITKLPVERIKGFFNK
ncbi:MAG: ATP-dependent DNA helicase [Candidatus Woesearchaeota archaeon]